MKFTDPEQRKFRRKEILTLHIYRSCREYLALNCYVALCYYKLDYYDVSQEVLAVYLQHYPDRLVQAQAQVCTSIYKYKHIQIQVYTSTNIYKYKYIQVLQDTSTRSNVLSEGSS